MVINTAKTEPIANCQSRSNLSHHLVLCSTPIQRLHIMLQAINFFAVSNKLFVVSYHLNGHSWITWTELNTELSPTLLSYCLIDLIVSCDDDDSDACLATVSDGVDDLLARRIQHSNKSNKCAVVLQQTAALSSNYRHTTQS